MKTRILLVSILMVLLGTTLWAARRAWETEKRPPVTLGLAYELSLEVLRKQFPEESRHYYCAGAKLQRTFTEGDWELRFFKAGEKSDGIVFSVGSDKSVRFAKGGFEY